MGDMTPQGLDTTLTREELLQARDEDAKRIRLTDPKGRRQASVRCCVVRGRRGSTCVRNVAWTQMRRSDDGGVPQRCDLRFWRILCCTSIR